MQVNAAYMHADFCCCCSPPTDSHPPNPRRPVHVWTPTDQQDSFPFAGALIGSSSTSTEPPLPGYAELLVSEMEAAGVQGAMIVQVMACKDCRKELKWLTNSEISSQASYWGIWERC